MCWSFTEVVRFSFYTLKQVGQDSGLLSSVIGFLRYNSFLVLYPLGVSGELITVYKVWAALDSTPYGDRPLTISLPNTLNFGVDFRSILLLFVPIYAYFFP